MVPIARARMALENETCKILALPSVEQRPVTNEGLWHIRNSGGKHDFSVTYPVTLSLFLKVSDFSACSRWQVYGHSAEELAPSSEQFRHFFLRVQSVETRIVSFHGHLPRDARNFL